MHRLMRHLRVKDDLQEQVAEFIRKRAQVVARNRLGNLVSLLDSVRSNGREVFVQGPAGYLIGVTQLGHNGEQLVDVRRFGFPAVIDF